MHPYLKTLDTNRRVAVKIKLRPIDDNGPPYISVRINNSFLFTSFLNEEVEIVTYIALLEHLDVSITLRDKKPHPDKETALMIERFTVDDFSVLPNYTGVATYENEGNVTSPTTYLGFNGEWRFQLTEPFYHWRHKITGQGWLLQPQS